MWNLRARLGGATEIEEASWAWLSVGPCKAQFRGHLGFEKAALCFFLLFFSSIQIQ